MFRNFAGVIILNLYLRFVASGISSRSLSFVTTYFARPDEAVDRKRWSSGSRLSLNLLPRFTCVTVGLSFNEVRKLVRRFSGILSLVSTPTYSSAISSEMVSCSFRSRHRRTRITFGDFVSVLR